MGGGGERCGPLKRRVPVRYIQGKCGHHPVCVMGVSEESEGDTGEDGQKKSKTSRRKRGSERDEVEDRTELANFGHCVCHGAHSLSQSAHACFVITLAIPCTSRSQSCSQSTHPQHTAPMGPGMVTMARTMATSSCSRATTKGTIRHRRTLEFVGVGVCVKGEGRGGGGGDMENKETLCC